MENDIDVVIEELDKFTNADILDKITCKVLVIDAAAEVQPGKAKRFYDALKCPKDYLFFDEETTAQNQYPNGRIWSGIRDFVRLD